MNINTTKNITSYTIKEEDRKLCEYHAQFFPKFDSRFRGTFEDRKETFSIDVLAGQLGNLYGAIYLLGEEEGRKKYIEFREKMNADPYRGDGGQDLVGIPVDFKTSYNRNGYPVERLNLIVNAKERYPDITYIQLVLSYDEKTIDVIGWIDESQMTKEKSERFRNAYHTSFSELNPADQVPLHTLNSLYSLSE